MTQVLALVDDEAYLEKIEKANDFAASTTAAQGDAKAVKSFHRTLKK